MRKRVNRRKINDALNALSSKKTPKYITYLAAILIFLALILLPPILGIFTKFDTIQQIFNQPALMNRALIAIANSFIIALLVSAFDVIAGVPMAWLITRGKSRWLSILDTLADIPFIVPTAALGYSLLLFWNGPEGISALFGGSLISPGWLLIALLHFTFSFPIVVRVMVGALLDYKMEFERASRTLGASPFTAVRTVTMPILRPSLIASYILAFARSLSETGATFIVAGLLENGPVFLQNIKNELAVSNPSLYEGATVFTSLVLIVVSLAIFAFIRIFGSRLRLPIKGFWPSFERKLSYKKAEASRNSITLIVFFLIVLIPSLFVALPAFEALFNPTLSEAFSGSGIWSVYWQSLVVSYALAGIVTLLSFVIGLPMALMIARKRFGRLTSTTFDILVNVPLIVPSIALGVSLKFFWQSFAFVPEFLLLVFAHLAITYPYFVRSMTAAFERISLDMEEAARTLGAKPFDVFRTIMLPLTKYSILSGAIIVFTRSVSETGATLAVVTTLQTAPVVIVNWVKQVVPATPSDIGLGCGILIVLSLAILLTLRFVTRGKGRY
ncbi:MAG: ABC transporter permease subunit [Candidatus Bathyarchaeota archaeon]|nr:ABC transporter permease subunit [Candidatus Bathyarchaeota archaeon]